MADEVRTHLESPAARGLGAPDCVLLLGASRFPVHRAVVACGSGLLRQLLEEYGGGGEGGGAPPKLRLLGADGGGRGPAPAGSSAAAASVSKEQLESFATHFASYLERLYSPTGTAPLPAGFDVAAARPLLALVDLFDSPHLLPEIDVCLAASLGPTSSSAGYPLLDFDYKERNNSVYYFTGCLTHLFSDCLELAAEFGLRRTMAEMMSALSLGHLVQDKAQVSKYLNGLNAAPLAALNEYLVKERFFNSRGCTGGCASTDATKPYVCQACKDAVKSSRLHAVAMLEKLLLERGWGYRRARGAQPPCPAWPDWTARLAYPTPTHCTLLLLP